MSEPRAVPDDLRRAVEEVLPGARADLESLVRIPSIWADPAHADDTRRSADAVAELARAAGAQRVDVIAAEGGAPAVVAHWPAPDGAPTVMLYAHHDVQPTGGDELWTTAPFEPTERDGRLYGRGAADDKAGVMTHLAVLRAFGGRPPVGVVLFVEGEEESGSPTLSALLAEHRDALAADVIVIADAANAAVDVPALTTSLRGLANIVVEVAMLERAAHSGMFGGPAGDALTALCHLLASLHDDKGEVAVPGLTVGSSDAPSPDEETFRGDAALLDDVDQLGTGSITERLAHKPAIAVLGIDAPAVDGAANVLLPRARAMVSVRLAPGDEVTRAVAAVTEHLRRHVPWAARLEVSTRASAEPFALDTTDAVHDLARAALGAAFGHDAVDMGMGGSIPFIAEFARTYPGATVMVTGVGDPASRWHGIDESLHLEMFGRCALAEAEFLRLLAEEPYTHADSVHVDAAPEVVYDVVADVTRTGEWSVFTRACEWDEGSLDAEGRPVVGASFTGHNSRPGRDWDTHSEVVAADRGREFAWAVNGGLVRWAYEMAPEESASGGRGTRLTQRWVFTPEGREFIRGKFGEDGVALRVEDARTSIPTTLARVRDVVEGQAGVAGAV